MQQTERIFEVLLSLSLYLRKFGLVSVIRCNTLMKSFSCITLLHILPASQSITQDFSHTLSVIFHLYLDTLTAISFLLLLTDFQKLHNCIRVTQTDSQEVVMEVGPQQNEPMAVEAWAKNAEIYFSGRSRAKSSSRKARNRPNDKTAQ